MNNKLESIVGLVIIVIAVGFLAFTYRVTGMRTLEETYPLKARFDQIEGIVTGSDVRVSGVKIGSVVSLELDPKQYNALMTVAINEFIKLPKDSSMKIVSSGLLGDKYVSVEIGGDENVLAPGDEIQHTQSSINIETLISKAIFSQESKEKK